MLSSIDPSKSFLCALAFENRRFMMSVQFHVLGVEKIRAL